MKKQLILISISILQLVSIQAEETTSKSLASTIEVYVFPGKGQDTEQQSKDEVECFNWASSNTGTDPFALSKESESQAQATEQAKSNAENAGRGAGASGALRGAAAGAIIGEIADDDSSKGASIGAAVGLVRGRRTARNTQSQAVAAAEQTSQNQQAESSDKLENFKKAFSVCLESKTYMVKY